MKKHLLFFIITIFIVGGLFSQTHKTLHVVDAGSLHTLFSDEEKVMIDSLVLTGNLDARDFRFIRDSLTILTVLDVKEVEIVEYIGTEGTLNGEKHTYLADIFPPYAFYRSYALQKLAYDSLTFIPDGGGRTANCYETSVTATTFEDATIKSKNNILSVGVKIEHSYLGDLTLQLVCPNGQSAFLKGNIWPYTFEGLTIPMPIYMLGIPYGGPFPNYLAYDDGSNDPETNPVGITWQYCWTEHSDYMTNNIGKLARTNVDKMSEACLDSVETPWGTMIKEVNYGQLMKVPIDSTHYAKKTGFFVPEETFDNLIGCPINGEWKLIVCDHIAGDNGWIEEWNIDLRYKNAEEQLSSKTNHLSESKNSLITIYLPSDVEGIGEFAFYGCSGLENITILSPIPPVVNEKAFAEIEELANINLYVLDESVLEYKEDEDWGKFFVYEKEEEGEEEDNPVSLSPIINEVDIYPNPTKGKINIDFPLLLHEIQIYNIGGELISTTINQSVIDISSYPNGVYFIKINNSVKKIIKSS